MSTHININRNILDYMDCWSYKVMSSTLGSIMESRLVTSPKLPSLFSSNILVLNLDYTFETLGSF